MEIITILLCVMIGLTSSETVSRFEFPVFFRNSSGDFSNVHGEPFKYNEDFVESRFQWESRLPRNVTMKQLLQISDKYYQAFENHLDKLRQIKRIANQHYSVNINIEKLNEKGSDDLPEKENTRAILADYITVDFNSDMVIFSVIVSKKIYDELDKEHVRDTLWFKKNLDERKNGIETAAKGTPGFYDAQVEFV